LAESSGFFTDMPGPIKPIPWTVLPRPGSSSSCVLKTSEAEYLFSAKYFSTLKSIALEHNREIQSDSPAATSVSTTI
jgi:hypothetical protein